MRSYIILAATAALFTACDARVGGDTPPVVEKNTTIFNPPATDEKKVEHNTTIVNPPPATVEKKTETTTVTGPGGSVEKKTSETSK